VINVLLADHQPIVREGLEKVLSQDQNVRIAGVVQRGSEVMDYFRTRDCDILILELSMPDRNGLAILERLKSNKRHLKILVLTSSTEDFYALQALKSGADGYLTKECSPTELMSAVRRIASGGKYISPSVAEKLCDIYQNGDGHLAPHHALSTREFQIMCLIASGKKPKQIADALNLAVRTINTYRERILGKMQMKSNAELTRYVTQNGL
jgi:two-component system invasion response regulator UvrY